MPIFHRKAFEVASKRPVPSDTDFKDLKGLGRALDQLSPEQRCDALYADWLIRLNTDRLLILPLRDRLIDQGALAANYLAELAQNADDAAEEVGAELRVKQSEDWLFVANNSRPLTSGDLFGLCRFFGHGVELTEETIGKFGIGFKSSYRIASEVYVRTWKNSNAFGFRLPICRTSEKDSHPSAVTLERLIRELEAALGDKFDEEVGQLKCLGYCTPEFASEIPSQLLERTAELRNPERGTLFCFHIRPDRVSEVQNRISGQVHQLYELCPLFLPHLRVVQLGPNELLMQEHRRDEAYCIPELVEADRVTLTTQPAGSRPSHSRFWRLRGTTAEDRWAVAFHADHEFRIRVEREDDEQGPTLKDGAAYAFFPLNSVNWPYRLHFHIDQPTNLARDNWNPSDEAVVKQQMRRAVAGLTRWLEKHTGKWHPNWRIESLISRRPNQNEQWAWQFWECLREEMRERALLRTFTGGFATTEGAKSVALMAKPEARSAWCMVLQHVPGSADASQLVEVEKDSDLVRETLTPGELADFCVAAAKMEPRNAELERAAVTALLGLTTVSLRAIENVVRSIECDLANGTTIPLEELFQQPGGAELTPEWHEAFSRLSKWASEAVWRDAAVCGLPLRVQLEKLSAPVFNPTWRELPSLMPDEAAWRKHGSAFWEMPRSACPESLKESVLACLRVPGHNGAWVQVSDLWLEDDSPTACFGGLLKSWHLPYNDRLRQDCTAKIRSWGLYSAWEKRSKSRIREELAGVLTVSLGNHDGAPPFAAVFNDSFERSRRVLEDGWKLIVSDAEKAATRRFVDARQRELQLSGKILLSSAIPPAARDALLLHPDFAAAPVWATEDAWQRVLRLGLSETCSFEFLDEKSFRSRKLELAKSLLEEFHKWKDNAIAESTREGLESLFSAASARQRSDWYVALSPQKKRPLKEFFAGLVTASQEGKPEERLMASCLTRAKLHADPLPTPLNAIPSLVEAAINLEKLRCERDGKGELLLEREQVEEVLAGEPDALALANDSIPLAGAPQGLRLRWFHGDDLVAELPEADVAYLNGTLVFGRFSRPAAEQQYVRLLSLYELSDTESPEYQKAKRQGVAPFDLYARFRDQIVEVLVKKHVKEVGYQREHVLRELLQNAESAYASKKQSVAVPWVECRIKKFPTSELYLVTVRHAGRAFNEPDRDGKDRPDIERIIKINAPNQNTEQEVGRFNRGFKSVFTVAHGGAVRIRSGQYKFEIQDLLLLSPAEPRPTFPPQPDTEFEFATSPADSLALLRLKEPPGSKHSPPVLNPTSLVFLSQLRRVRIEFEERPWEWQVDCKRLSGGWTRLEVVETTSGKGESFLVYHGKMESGKHYGVAVRLDKNGLPQKLEDEWRTLRLTFETERAFGLDLLVNGDFDADQGRVNVRSLAATGTEIIRAAVNTALENATMHLRISFSKEMWTAWAKVLHLKDSSEVLGNCFGQEASHFSTWITRLEDLMTSSIPCAAAPLPFSEAEFPTRLMRLLAKDFGGRWGLATTAWIESEAEAELPHRLRDGKIKQSLHRWISGQRPLSPVLYAIQKDLRQPAFETLRRSLSKPERDELAQAEKILEEKLRPVEVIEPEEEEPQEVLLPTFEAWTVEQLYYWWVNQQSPQHEYTLEGANWSMLYPKDIEKEGAQRVARLKRDLSRPDSDEGRAVYYRLFGLACLMSAGRRTSEIREFWAQDLESRGFWADTSKRTFSDEADKLFEKLVHQRFNTITAAKERAYFWRRVFYDIRKIHKMVWENDFPTVMMDVAKRADSGRALIEFLRSGHLRGQEAWVGVFGQSAGAPLFFVVRELRRLGVVENRQLDPFAFFACTPVRRAAARIGWLSEDSTRAADFESLAYVSEQLHKRISSDSKFGAKLLPCFDIPLLHLGING